MDEHSVFPRSFYSEHAPSQEENNLTNVKIIIRDGVVESILADSPDICAEIIDIDKDHDDYHAADAYGDELYQSDALQSIDFAYAGFEA